MSTAVIAQQPLEYPDSDGQPVRSLDETQWVTVKMAAAMLEKSRSQTSRDASHGKLEAIGHGRHRRISLLSIAAYKRDQTMRELQIETKAEVRAKLRRAEKSLRLRCMQKNSGTISEPLDDP